jgi:uncharacterized protein
MFPLGTVLLPGAYLSLHVFEPRYRALVQACLDGTPEFGVALIERGSEVGGGDSRFDVGCVARIVEAVRFEDGRWALGTVGVRRIAVERWLPETSYPRAEVVELPDGPAGPLATSSRASLVAACRRVLAMAAELGDAAPAATVDFADDPVAAGYQLAAVAPVGPLDKLALLAAATPDDRAELLRRLLDDAATVLAARVAGG